MTTADQPVQIDEDGDDDDDDDGPHILLADQIMTTNMICIICSRLKIDSKDL